MKYPLLLSATRSSWQVPANHGTDSDKNVKMKEVRHAVLERDDYTCQFCGFKAKKWQEIHHLNDNHNDFVQSNLVTACAFCHQCFHLGLAGSTAGGELIWLPEIEQADLNHLVRSIFVARYFEGGKLFNAARSIYDTLSSQRRAFMEQHFSAGSSNPANLGQVLLKMKTEDYEKRATFLKNIKLIPSESRFQVQIKYWAESVYRDLPPDSWENLLKKELLESVAPQSE